jgi:hypothetical protein
LLLAFVPVASRAQAPAPHTLDDYRHFRAAAIDLLGRMPTREEIEAFERPGFNFDAWIDKHLDGPGYVERLTRIYMDLLRLEPNVNFFVAPAQLSRKQIVGPDGKKLDVLYRTAQRRLPEAVDGTFCFAQEELTEPLPAPTVQSVSPNKAPAGMPGVPIVLTGKDLQGTSVEIDGVRIGSMAVSPTELRVTIPAPKVASPGTLHLSVVRPPPGGGKSKPIAFKVVKEGSIEKPPPPPPPKFAFAPQKLRNIPQKLLDERTVLVRPWWLYRDYRDSNPAQRYTEASKESEPEFRLTAGLLKDSEGKPITEVRVCREEAQAEETGHVYASGRTKFPPPPKPGEMRPLTRFAPLDTPFATEHKGEPLACDTKTALQLSVDCGCGRGLERCMPTDGDFGGGAAFEFPNHMPLGPGSPLDNVRQPATRWFPYWWSREVVHFLGYLFEKDRDFREILTGKETLVNGPLAQFYRSVQRGNCCGPEASFGMTEETEPLFEPKRVPTALMPHDVGNWVLVADRGPRASGLLTMPMFLEKYASNRARGAAIYNAFLCKSFVAENLQLTASTENDLTVRPGCSTCHATLEPLAAYFARVETGNFVFLPPSKIPVVNPACKKDPKGKFLLGPAGCNSLYDITFTSDRGATLRSAYGSPKNADATPAGAGAEIVSKPEFAECAVSRVTSSFLGRPMNADDEAMLKQLATAFGASGFKMRALVHAILRSDAYRRANNLSSTSWRAGKQPDMGATPPVQEPPHPPMGGAP